MKDLTNQVKKPFSKTNSTNELHWGYGWRPHWQAPRGRDQLHHPPSPVCCLQEWCSPQSSLAKAKSYHLLLSKVEIAKKRKFRARYLSWNIFQNRAANHLWEFHPAEVSSTLDFEPSMKVLRKIFGHSISSIFVSVFLTGEPSSYFVYHTWRPTVYSKHGEPEQYQSQGWIYELNTKDYHKAIPKNLNGTWRL